VGHINGDSVELKETYINMFVCNYMKYNIFIEKWDFLEFP